MADETFQADRVKMNIQYVLDFKKNSSGLYSSSLSWMINNDIISSYKIIYWKTVEFDFE